MKMLPKAVVAVMAFVTSACANMPALPSMPGLDLPSSSGEASIPPDATKMAPGKVGTALLAQAAELLAAGKEPEAKGLLQNILSASPRDATAQNFLRQIEIDPVKLLGEPSTEPYVVQTGDTMSELADRFLGDSRLFYALSRYNGLLAPNALAVGRTLKLPSGAKRQSAPAVTAAAPTAVAKVDAAHADDMRLQALQMLNKGEVDGAIAILRQAVARDGSDPAIRKDLERAELIKGALSKQ